MINLLPPELREGYRYGRTNTELRNWIIATSIAIAGLVAIGTLGLVNIKTESRHVASQISSSQQSLADNDLEKTQQEVKDVSNSLKLATQVLSQEVLFSKLITQIGSAMPPGAVLTALNVNKSNGGLDLTANATNYYTATQVQVNLASTSTRLFSKVDINNINCNDKTGKTSRPCTVNLRALYNSENQFLLINQGKKKS